MKKNPLHIIGYQGLPLSLCLSVNRLIKYDVMKYPESKHIYLES